MGADNAILVAALAYGAYYVLSNMKGAPTYRDINGNAITQIQCGNSITFEVPGYKKVWLSQLKNGSLSFDGPYDVPMPAYILNCSNDVGIYDVAVYEIDSNNVKGALIGQTKFSVLQS